MTTVADVLQDLLDPRVRSSGRPRRSVELIEHGVVYLDYGDSDREFRLTVQQIPKRRLHVPVGVAGVVGGVDVRLVEVVLGSGVKVAIEGMPGPTYDEALTRFRNAQSDWERSLGSEQGGADQPNPPSWPAERLKGCVRLRDDRGTTYGVTGGMLGGAGTEWTAVVSFSPAPGPDVRELYVQLMDGETIVGNVALSLNPLAR